jgi:hypothetical protein
MSMLSAGGDRPDASDPAMRPPRWRGNTSAEPQADDRLRPGGLVRFHRPLLGMEKDQSEQRPKAGA